MKITIRNRCSDFNGYRAARVKSLFNAESGCNFDLDADLDIDRDDWQIGVVVGPSGSGKTSIGRAVFGDPAPFWVPDWPNDQPIIEAIAPDERQECRGACVPIGGHAGMAGGWCRVPVS